MLNQDLFVDIELTRSCNLRCTYCYEKGCYENKYISKDQVDYIFSRLNEIVHLQNLHIVLWGGEPLLNEEASVYLIEKYAKHIKRILILTNGTLISNYLKLFSRFRDKVWIQISYDGEPINSLTRKDINGKPTTNIVLKNVKRMIQESIDVSLKPTLDWVHTPYMFDAYKDYVKIRQTLLPNLIYNPTIDHYVKDIDDQTLEVFRNQLLKIVSFSVKNCDCILSWFINDAKPLCSAGFNLFSIDVNLDVYPCHGCFYYDNTLHKWGNLESLSYRQIEERRKLFYQAKIKAEKHTSCSYSFCRRCYVTAFHFSDKPDYFSRWIDFTSQPVICKTSKLIHIAKQAYKQLCKR